MKNKLIEPKHIMENILFEVYQPPLLTKDNLQDICHAHELKHYKKGDYLLQEGQIANEYFIVEEGLIRTFVYHYQGEDITTGFSTKKDVVIEVCSIFSRIPTNENMQCLTDAQLWKINFTDFQQLFDRIPAFREWGRSWMASELYKNKKRATKMITRPATERYLQLIKSHPEMILQSPLKYIASYLGITDTSLSRIRKEVVNNRRK